MVQGLISLKLFRLKPVDPGSTKTYYLFHLSNGSTLKWRERDTDVYSRDGRELRYINVLDITDWK